MATKTEMATEIVLLLNTLEKFRRDVAEKDARIAAQAATIANLEFRRVELVSLPQAVETAAVEYETGRRWCEKGLVASAEKRGGRWFVNPEDFTAVAAMHSGNRSFPVAS